MQQQQNIIDTPEFWEQVKSDFEASQEDHFICPTSPLFISEWIHQQEKIRELARLFLSNNSEWSRFRVWRDAFFGTVDLEEGFLRDYREVRLNFLDYMINRTRTNGL